MLIGPVVGGTLSFRPILGVKETLEGKFCKLAAYRMIRRSSQAVRIAREL